MGSTAKYLELAVILTAVDKLSGTVNNALGGATNQFNKFANSKERADASFKDGLKMAAGAKIGIDMLSNLARQYGDVQEAQNALRIAMMQPGGSIDESAFGRYADLAVNLSKKFGGTQQSYYEMIRAMKENRLDEKDILGGIGFADAELAELFKAAPAEAALFTARMKNDMRVLPNEMVKMVDLVARLKQVGVGATGQEAIVNLTEFFSKAGLGASNLGLHGTKDAMELGTLGAMFIAKGQDAPSVGTTFRRIFDNIANPDKLHKMNEAAAEFGKKLVFYDDKGHFKGVKEMVAQLSTLQGMKVPDIAKILGPMGSANGMSGDVLKQLSEFGRSDYVDFARRVEEQGDLTAKVAEYQKGLNAQLQITKSNIDNLGSSIGKSYNPMVQRAVTLTGKLADWLTQLVNGHQLETGVVAGLTGIAAGAMAIGSAVKFIGSAWVYSGVGKIFGLMAETDIFAALMVSARGLVATIGLGVIPALEGVGIAVTAAFGTIAAAAAVLALFYKEVQKGNRMLPNKEYKDQTYTPNTAEGRISHFADKAEEAAYQRWWLSKAKAGVPYSMLERGDYLKTNPVLPKSLIDLDILTKQIKGVIKPAQVYAMPGVSHSQPSLNYAPVINIQGNADKQMIKDTLEQHKADILRLLKSHKHDNNRREY